MKINECLDVLEIHDTVLGVSKHISPSLLRDGQNIILVDTGYPNQYPLFAQAFERAGLSIDCLTGIILTHQDLDHIGSLADILNQVPHKIATMAHELDKPYIDGEKVPLKLAQLETIPSPLPPILEYYKQLNADFRQSEMPIDRALRDGEHLPYCGGITVVHAPGHTPGHICLYLSKYKLLLCGDVLKVIGGELTYNNPIHNYDQQLYMASLGKLTHFDIEIIVCYHGGAYSENVRERLEQLANK